MVKLGTIDKFQLDSVIVGTVTSLVVHVTTPSAGITLEEVDSQVTRTERNDEAIFENQRNIKTNKRARSFTKVTNVILSIGHVVLYNHVAVTYAIVLVLLDHKVVVDVTLARLLKGAQDGTPIIFASLRADKALCIDV